MIYGNNTQDTRIDVGKNEIVNEYFYDSEEESQLQKEREFLKSIDFQKEGINFRERLATEKLQQELDLLAKEQQKFFNSMKN